MDAFTELVCERLRAIKPCVFPSLADSSQSSSSAGWKTIETRPRRNKDALQALSNSLGCTSSAIARTAWAIVLQSFTNEEELCFAALSGNERHDVPHVILIETALQKTQVLSDMIKAFDDPQWHLPLLWRSFPPTLEGHPGLSISLPFNSLVAEEQKSISCLPVPFLAVVRVHETAYP